MSVAHRAIEFGNGPSYKKLHESAVPNWRSQRQFDLCIASNPHHELRFERLAYRYTIRITCPSKNFKSRP